MGFGSGNPRSEGWGVRGGCWDLVIKGRQDVLAHDWIHPSVSCKSSRVLGCGFFVFFLLPFGVCSVISSITLLFGLSYSFVLYWNLGLLVMLLSLPLLLYV